MNLIELEIQNVCECKHAILRFPPNLQKSQLYLVHSTQRCEIITLALQLVFGIKYSKYSALHEIRNKIYKGKIKITFTLLQPAMPECRNPEERSKQDHSSDSDVPCTSRQARERLERRLKKRRNRDRLKNVVVVKACRDFTLNPDIIGYTINGGALVECSVVVFQIRFSTCTDVIFPRLTNITHGEYCNGKWLDLLSTEFIDGDNPLKQFCKLYAKRKLSKTHILSNLTTSVLKGLILFNNSRISHLINIFNDIRWLFEYMTCSEFTVWFLLPSVFGNLSDISQITIENTNFDLMKTEIQLKQANATPFPWINAEKHVQELFLVAVQLAFGYHCQQNIIYLHSLNYLEKHQNFEYLNYLLIQSSSSRQLSFEKNYFQRIFNVCAKLNICCILEYCGGLLSYPSQAFLINCTWLNSSKEWKLSVKDYLPIPATNSETAHNFLQELQACFT